jgi:carbonic anhydrase
MKLGLLLATVLLAPLPLRAQWKTPWTYDGATGPEHWGDLDPDYGACKSGKEQSPIDIRNARKGRLPAIRFEYRSGPLQYLINNGKTIRVNYHDAPAAGNFLIAGSTRYQLTQFHFHRPSEETVNGKPYDMEVHLMHESSDGKVAGVTVFLKAGAPNATIQKLWDHMPQAEGNEQEIPGVEVDPAGLLPRDAAYFTYMGSLTAPPCTEGVTWFVLETPVAVSPAQIAAFARLYPHDVRPVQPLNGRAIKQSK